MPMELNLVTRIQICLSVMSSKAPMRPRSKISAKLVRLSPSSLSGDAIACAFVVGSLVTVFVVLKEEEEIK